MIAIVAGCLSLGSVGTAAAETFVGTFEGSRHVNLTTNVNGEPRAIVFHRWRATCSGGVKLTEGTIFSPLTPSSPRKFVAKGNYVVHQRDGDYDITIRDTARGRRVSDTQWAGTFKALGIVRSAGEVIDRCRLAPTPWRASLPGPSLSHGATASIRGDG